MPTYAGRTNEARDVALTKTSGAATVTAASGTFYAEDVGRTVTGTGVAASTTIASVQSTTAATLSANATASNSATATLGVALSANTGYTGWSPETGTEALSYTVTANNAGTPVAPDRVTSNVGPKPGQRYRG